MKRLYRSRKDRVISGICGGIGEYLNVDPVLVRVVAVLLIFTGGVGIVAYIAGILIIPEQPETEIQSGKDDEGDRDNREETSPSEAQNGSRRTPSHSGSLLFGLILVIIGAFFLLRNIPFLNHYYWWIRYHLSAFFWPGILIGFGVFLIIRNSRT